MVVVGHDDGGDTHSPTVFCISIHVPIYAQLPTITSINESTKVFDRLAGLQSRSRAQTHELGPFPDFFFFCFVTKPSAVCCYFLFFFFACREEGGRRGDLSLPVFSSCRRRGLADGRLNASDRGG